jgi:hypothetical protein
VVVKQGNRHAWRNKDSQPATLVFVLMGKKRGASLIHLHAKGQVDGFDSYFNTGGFSVDYQRLERSKPRRAR